LRLREEANIEANINEGSDNIFSRNGAENASSNIENALINASNKLYIKFRRKYIFNG